VSDHEFNHDEPEPVSAEPESAEDVWDVAAWVSPNPGGVGPMTRAMLLSNIVAMAEKAQG